GKPAQVTVEAYPGTTNMDMLTTAERENITLVKERYESAFPLVDYAVGYHNFQGEVPPHEVVFRQKAWGITVTEIWKFNRQTP
ncbi:hypothetical protein PTM75_14985, partial [Clostridium perfringens]|nr:hypothetical protein [Clostridium perfringens]